VKCNGIIKLDIVIEMELDAKLTEIENANGVKGGNKVYQWR